MTRIARFSDSFDHRIRKISRSKRHATSCPVLIVCASLFFCMVPDSAFTVVQVLPRMRGIDANESDIPDFRVNERIGDRSTALGAPALAVDREGRFVIVWQDVRADEGGDIFVQCYYSDGTPRGDNVRVNDDSGVGVQKEPAVACHEDGSFIVVWQDGRDLSDASDVYAQRYSSDGTTVGANFKVNEDEKHEWQGSPSVSCDGIGNFVIAWRDKRDQGFHVYAQRYSEDGVPVGSNFLVKDEGVGDYPPSVDCDSDGNFVITWSAKRYSGYAVLAKLYWSDGSPAGNNFEVHLDERGDSHPDVTMFEPDGFVLAWEDTKHSDRTDIYAQLYSRNARPIGDNVRVNHAGDTTAQLKPSVASNDSGDFVIAWADRRTDDDIRLYAQRMTYAGSRIGVNFPLSSDYRRWQNDPDIALLDDRLYATWVESAPDGSGFDIWAHVVALDAGTTRPTSSVLYQNWPNPFNLNTEICFDLSHAGTTTLKIFDLSGREVATLISEFLNSGRHRTEWEADGLASGVYIYRLHCGSTVETRKMILLR